MERDLYEILEVPRNATQEEMKKSYRRLARKFHPDANPDDSEAEERFKEVALAYETLSDVNKRAKYDRYGEVGNSPGGGDPFSGLGDIFESFFGSGFGGGQRQRGPIQGQDLETSIELEFIDAVFGCEHEIKINTALVCTDCEATGANEGSSRETCSTCKGAGQVQSVRQSLLGQMMTTTACTSCGGLGWFIPDPCVACGGEGRRVEVDSFSVQVTPGVDNGTTLRLTGRGAVGPWGGPAGDLYVHIKVRSHKDFQRNGADLIRRLPIAITQAALGVEFDIDTLDGSVEVHIPPGTETGYVMRMKGQGVPNLQGRGRGDLLVQVVVDTPKNLTEKEEELLREFAELRDEDVVPQDRGLITKLRSAFR